MQRFQIFSRVARGRHGPRWSPRSHYFRPWPSPSQSQRQHVRSQNAISQSQKPCAAVCTTQGHRARHPRPHGFRHGHTHSSRQWHGRWRWRRWRRQQNVRVFKNTRPTRGYGVEKHRVAPPASQHCDACRRGGEHGRPRDKKVWSGLWAAGWRHLEAEPSPWFT